MGEGKLLGVQDDAVSAAEVEPLCSLMEALLDGVGPQEDVVDAFCLPGDVSIDEKLLFTVYL